MILGQTPHKKIGIMGGTFDPIHIGHLIIAEQAYDQYGLEKILVMPNGNPPHKKETLYTPIRHRIQMVQLAISDNRHFELSLTEAERNGYSYTFETLEFLKNINPHVEYYFIMGADSLFDFETWREPARICENCTVLAATRYNLKNPELQKQVEYLSSKFKGNFELLKTPNIDISSHMIRRMVEEHKSIQYYVPPDVERYIYRNHLYQMER
ncbi:nicotinate-nucleotide adenylyltransferase [Diplocloster agilis]|uniref:Probable nicotinate-nucleotide adenylyltransferase n=1 Tax=Diplocloster agilis TaxID=2850323 RepID=A0A949JW78_9FIRM|nr:MULTISPECIES: nicotinate-nucleotide adenylyltransferase [Lachnospiraceae]MBU9735234.1 nicotinate-nucleotide adenylyltransferase [Diplocloster agilis]MCU6733800.1 nicotinate-nucleotide adenylyltransferase [Suonthocola fibrivorans]SCJ09444.1 Nicotinate-nucleotide adenylyltransferase [uncultured Clostridium sp.]